MKEFVEIRAEVPKEVPQTIYPLEGKTWYYLGLDNGHTSEGELVNGLRFYIIRDSTTYQIDHVIMAYYKDCKYCGDYELNPVTFPQD